MTMLKSLWSLLIFHSRILGLIATVTTIFQPDDARLGTSKLSEAGDSFLAWKLGDAKRFMFFAFYNLIMVFQWNYKSLFAQNQRDLQWKKLNEFNAFLTTGQCSFFRLSRRSLVNCSKYSLYTFMSGNDRVDSTFVLLETWFRHEIYLHFHNNENKIISYSLSSLWCS